MSRFVLEDPASGLGLLRDALQGTPIPGVPSAASPMLLLDSLTSVLDLRPWLQEQGRVPIDIANILAQPVPALANTWVQALFTGLPEELLLILDLNIRVASTTNYARAGAAVMRDIQTPRLIMGGTGAIGVRDAVANTYWLLGMSASAEFRAFRPFIMDRRRDSAGTVHEELVVSIQSSAGGAMVGTYDATAFYVPLRSGDGVPQIGLW